MSIRSLTSSVVPPAAPGRSPQRLVEPGDDGVRGSLAALTRGQCHGIDLDPCTRDHERGDLDERRGGARLAEHLLPDGVHERPVVDVREEHGHLDHVGERAAGGGEHLLHVGEDGARLGDDVVAPDELAILVDGDDTADEQEVAGPNGVGEVRDRLGLTRDPVLAPLRQQPLRRARDDAQRMRCVERGRDRLRLARSPTMTFTWKSRSRRVSRPTAPRPAKHSNVPRRSFIAESGRKLEPPDRVAPADHDDHGAVGRDAVRGDLAVALDGLDAVRADDEQRLRVVVLVSRARATFDQPDGSVSCTPPPARRRPCAPTRRHGEQADDDGSPRSRAASALPSTSHLRLAWYGDRANWKNYLHRN